MRRPALYSSSRPARTGLDAPDSGAAAQAGPAGASDGAPSAAGDVAPTPASRRHISSQGFMWAAIVVLAGLLAFTLQHSLRSTPQRLTQEQFNQAVMKTLETQVMPSEYARAYENIRPSVVRVISYVKKSRVREGAERAHGHGDHAATKPKPLRSGPTGHSAGDDDEVVEHGIGTGVVIVDKGVILTSLHVVAGADRVQVVFFDGLQADASVTGVQPENDLAVLQASKIPDDLLAATMRSTADLTPGDRVLAVGFPFGIGPSASAGIVSGLGRSFRSPEGEHEMTNLIQFDAAANPGNSGGPLVTMDGEVVGIVAAILNPTPARTFLGIGFAVPIENAAAAAGLPPF
jgi:S1-C subfamily serine protease